MCDLRELPKIGNLKLGIRANVSTIHHALKSLDLKVKHFGNFSVLRDVYVYIIFWSGNYINITKVPNVRRVKASIRHLISLFKNVTLDIDLRSLKVHNICASGQFIRSYSLRKLVDHFRKSDEAIRVKLNPVFFPGLFVKYEGGTCTIFQNGKYTIVGCKNCTRIISIANSVCAYMKKL